MRFAKIGGQAVMEGVMMRCGRDYAVAVRRPDGGIEIKKDRYEGLASRLHVSRIPVVRGIFSFIDSLVLGMSTLTWSAGFYDEEDGAAGAEEAPPQEREDGSGQAAPQQGTGSQSGLSPLETGLTITVSIAAAIGIFMLIPYFISRLLAGVTENSFAISAFEGVVRIALFLLYIAAISRLKDIQRVFMYHGAEHKTINCIEAGMQLTPENAAGCTRLHKRCGTNFLLIVMIVSIVCFMFIQTDSPLSRILLRIVLVPVIAGISFEILQWAGRSSSPLVDILTRPGLMLQYLTTREPDQQMLETAIASIEAIYDWRQFQKEGQEGAA